MEKTTSGLSVTNVKKLDLKKCAVCQNAKDKRGDKKLTSTEKGRENLFRCSEILNDDKFKEIGDAEKSLVKYHINTCYARYVRSAERLEQRKEEVSGANEPEEIEENNSKENEDPSCMPRAKRRRSTEVKHCVVCNQMKCKGDKVLYRIETELRAKELLAACKFFKDDVYTNCLLMKNAGDVFAADVLYHRNCLNYYILKFKRELKALVAVIEDGENGNGVTKTAVDVIDGILDNLELANTGYSLSDVRDHINKELEIKNIGNLSLHNINY